MIEYRALIEQDLTRELFRDFRRHQEVNLCYRKVETGWVIQADPFVDDWSEEDYQFLIVCLKNTISTHGFVYGAFVEGKLKGFVSVEAEIFDEQQRYCDLSSLHVSEDMRHQGIGKKLFQAAKNYAQAQGARKLYISAHSAVESQAFYQAMGCVEATVYVNKHVEAEPFDCQLECLV